MSHVQRKPASTKLREDPGPLRGPQVIAKLLYGTRDVLLTRKVRLR
jgi:hypothetical protein